MQNEGVFAARIHYIGRFTGGSPIGFVRKYQSLLSKYFDVSALSGILEGKPGFSDMYGLLVRAAEIARAETDTTGGESAQGKNLASVFSRLSISGNQKPRKEFYRYHIRELSPENAFPGQGIIEQEHTTLANGFYSEMNRLAENPPDGLTAFMICFDRISQKYMWCYTASDFEGEDISLYDSMKVTEAVMSCLVRSVDKEKPFYLVTADFSGIQNYIFSISSANNKNVAKRLRARSFFVDVVSRVFSQYVADSFCVGRANILLQTGGKFYCMVPALKGMEERLGGIRDAFDRYLYDTFHGSVSVNMAWLGCDDRALVYYSDTIVELNDRLGENKTTPFQSILKDSHGWDPQAFILCGDLKNKHVCKNCGSELIDISKESCWMCDMQIEIGGKIPKADYIIYTRTAGKGTYPVFQDYYIRIAEKIHREDLEGVYLIEALNNAPDVEASLPVTRKYMANHIPYMVHKEDGKDYYGPKTFGEIADESSGTNKLAVLKADVDVLGFLFAQGLRSKERHFGTISRVNTMSRMLEVFFSGYIEQLLEDKKEYKDIYSVFSGGDDVFLIGPWDAMLPFAADIQKKFKEFAAGNEAVTMSASVSVFGSSEHIAFMAEYSEQQLERAKNELCPNVYPKRSGRDAVCAIGELLSWPDFNEQLENADRLELLLRTHKIETGALHRISKYSSMYKQFLVDKDIWKLMFEPLFYYDRQRNYRFNRKDEDCRWFLESYIKSMENAANYNSVKKNLYFAETAIKIAMNKTRKERG